MRLLSKYKLFLFAGGAAGILAACTDADVVSPGTTAPVTVISNPSSGGASFANRSTRPRSAGDCPTGTKYDANFTLPTGDVTSICKIDSANGAITGSVNVPFSADPIAIIGALFIGAGGSITFAPGQVLFGCGDNDALIVSQDGNLFAVGTQTQPIVFTSFDDLNDDLFANGTGGSGEWGGLVLNGNAPINDCTNDTSATPGTAACTKAGEGATGDFGGDNPADSSGDLSYVRVQHAGILFNSTNELNGIAFQGVGNGTNVDHVQIHKNADDGIEWFGGTVNAKYLVVTGAEDDSYDWTDGWQGNVQFALAVQDPTVGNRGIESDNREGAANQGAAQGVRSNPNWSNFTFIGRGDSGENDGIKMRRGTDGVLINGVVADFGLDGFDFDDDSLTATPTVDSTLFAGNGSNVESNAASMAIIAAGTNNETAGSSSLANGFLPGPVEQGVTPTDPTTLGSFFTAANYVGAFSSTETATSNWASGWTVGLGAATACPSGTIITSEAVPAGRTEARICRVLSPVAGDVTLTAGNLYQLQGTTFIGQDAGSDPLAPALGSSAATLTIAPGVTVFGNSGPDALVVSRGSQLFANGAANAPIVMTSREDVFSGTGDSGQWGGLVLNGRARINDCTVDTGATPGDVDCEKSGEGSTGNFGGATDDDNSGRLNYLRVQYAGFLFNSTNELNGIAFQGVGNGTEVDYVQVHANADDGVEWFGGTVNAKHLVMTAAEDDSFDWTDGWQGKVQYGIAFQDPTVGNRGIESDNREGAADQGAAQGVRSDPILANFTLIGRESGAENDGVKIRRGNAGEYYNFIITDFVGEGVDFDADSATTPVIFTSLVVDNAGGGEDAAASANGVFDDGLNGNEDMSGVAKTLTADAGFTAPLIPGGVEDTTPTSALSTTVDAFFDDVTYIGAVEDSSDDWYQGWTLPGSL